MWTSWYGAHSSGALASPIRFLFVRTRLCSTLPSDPLSRGRPCASLALRLHQAVQRTCTSKLSNMLGTPLALRAVPLPERGEGRAGPSTVLTIGGFQRFLPLALFGENCHLLRIPAGMERPAIGLNRHCFGVILSEAKNLVARMSPDSS